jgi:hypothetical protein
VIAARLVRHSLLIAAFAAPLAVAAPASAGGFHVHIGGGAHFGAGAHWGGGWGGGYRGPHVRWGGYHPGRVVVSGGIWVGGGTYYQPYYPGYYGYGYGYAQAPVCECGPSAYYPPVYPAPSTASMMPLPAEEPRMPTFGVGLFAGGTSTTDKADGNDVGLFANLRITRGLLIQGEIAKSTLADGSRIDRRFEGALVWEIGAENDWAPYLLGGVGVEGADTTDASATQSFGEVGAGLRWALTRSLHLTADIRAGSRETMTDQTTIRSAPGTTARTVAPPTADSGVSEDFTRARIGAMIYF